MALIEPCASKRKAELNPAGSVELGPGCRYLLVGYPPFLKVLMDEGTRRGMDWSQFDMQALLGGEGNSEALRSSAIKTAELSQAGSTICSMQAVGSGPPRRGGHRGRTVPRQPTYLGR